jgi:hypothetical protein
VARAELESKQDKDLGRADPALTGCLQAEADPDLARVVSAWPQQPPHIRAAVLALVGAALPRGE